MEYTGFTDCMVRLKYNKVACAPAYGHFSWKIEAHGIQSVYTVYYTGCIKESIEESSKNRGSIPLVFIFVIKCRHVSLKRYKRNYTFDYN